MAILKKLQKFLEDSKVKYEIVEHKKVFTAHDKAATLRVPEKIVGKTLLVRLDPATKSGASKEVVVVLIPTNKNLDKQKLKKLSKAKQIDFVKEAWMKKNLKGVKEGANPPFGNLYKLKTFVDRGLMLNKKIIINSGDNKSSIKINPSVLKKIIPDVIISSFSKSRKN